MSEKASLCSTEKILVTGANGGLGRAIVEALLTKVLAVRFIASVRDIAKAADLAEHGVELRRADYLDTDSLKSSLEGVSKLFLVSAPPFTDRVFQHINVIDAAKSAGVEHVFYPSIQRIDDTTAPIEWVTRSDIETENYLKASGLGYTILKFPLYIEGLMTMLARR